MAVATGRATQLHKSKIALRRIPIDQVQQHREQVGVADAEPLAEGGCVLVYGAARGQAARRVG